MPYATPQGVQSIVGNVTVDSVTSPVPVEGTFWPAEQSVSGQGALLSASGQVGSEGNNTLLTPVGGKKLRVYYLSYNPLEDVTAGFRFGAAGGLFLYNAVFDHAIVAKDYGDFRYLEGAVDEPLVLNLSGAIATNWNCNYVEV